MPKKSMAHNLYPNKSPILAKSEAETIISRAHDEAEELRAKAYDEIEALKEQAIEEGKAPHPESWLLPKPLPHCPVFSPKPEYHPDS